ncbi:two-component system sensor histidine kinase NtrB [Alicyclobacillus sp. ALC3]|uniref:two-component system sensor histidine kinase NtrB n=1 Tax=Alicyclobacillus sp. ALC3 TaxID=2796143 RepID=UPI002377F141|nr:ATP-binding protein [Alicyclobacillus sp. ALC3]WDL99025.1 two-component sensor histidine kinase [Alicyclobacillus sp. ALC3]
MGDTNAHDVAPRPEDVINPPWHLNAAVLFIDTGGNLWFCNEQSRTLFNTGQPLYRGVPLSVCIPTEGEEYRVLAKAAAEAQELRDFVMRWEVDGRVRHVLIDTFQDVNPLTGQSGLYMFMKDIGNFTSIDQQVQHAEKLSMTSKMAAGIAHEIRNPLTAIKGFLQVLTQRFEAAQMNTELEFANVMMAEMGRLERLVSELLLLSTPRAGQRSVSRVLDLVRSVLPSREGRQDAISVRVDVPDDIYIEADSEMIRTALAHLIQNGVEAMEAGGDLAVSAAQTGDHLEIHVRDSGPGIPYYMMDKVFDAFFTTKDKGIGLGLPIVEKVMEAHQGEIRVSSKGFGTTFTMRLPVAQALR